MAILYRPHRGGLREAMDEAMAFDTKEELQEHAQQHWKYLYPEGRVIFGRTDIEVDERIGWLTTYVLLQRDPKDEKSTTCVGMCDIDTYVESSKEEALAFTKKIYQLWDKNKESYMTKKTHILMGYYDHEDKEGFPILKGNDKEYMTLLFQNVYTPLVHKRKLFFYQNGPYYDIQLKEYKV